MSKNVTAYVVLDITEVGICRFQGASHIKENAESILKQARENNPRKIFTLKPSPATIDEHGHLQIKNLKKV